MKFNYPVTLGASKSVGARALFAAFAFIICFAAAQSISAATFVVNSTADANDATAGDGICETAAGNGICTLRAAISEANMLAGADIITLPAGTYTNTLGGVDDVNATGDLDITGNLTINGAGSGTTIIQANAAAGVAVERVIHFPVSSVTAVFNGVTIRNGRQATATFGGGVRVNNAGDNVTFNDCVISNNFSGFGGGGIIINAASASVTLNNTTVTGNTAASATGTNIGFGGGIALNAAGATLNVNNSTITNNTASTSVAANAQGGGIYDVQGNVTITNSTISGNTVTSSASSTRGGGIYNLGGTLTMTGGTVSGNTAAVTAGTGVGVSAGLENQQGTATITNSTISGNTGNFNSGIYTLSAGLAATTTVNRSAIVNNTAATEAAGLSNSSVGATNATTTLNNTTVGGNTTAGVTGGAENSASSTGNAILNINYSTVAGNAADTGNTGNGGIGGVGNFANTASTGLTTVNVQSSIIADNTVGTGSVAPDIFGVITSLNYNHIENTTGGTFAPMANDVTGVDPGLTPLALNGGLTLNYLPAFNSPVIDTIPNGTNGCGTAPFNVDQKNVIRPFDTNFNGTAECEKGASERGLVIITTSPLASGFVGQSYSQTLTADYGFAPYTFSLAGGTLPPGLTLNPNGTINGTPTTPGTYTFSATVQDSPVIALNSRAGKILAPSVSTSLPKVFQIVINPITTAASVTISGRVTTPEAAGLINAPVTLTDSHGGSRTVLTGKFGSFVFTDVELGETYILSVASRKYTYTEQVISPNGNITGITFIPQ